jgi:PAS domain-containing protein
MEPRHYSFSIKPVRPRFIVMSAAIVLCVFAGGIITSFLPPFQPLFKEAILSLLAIVLFLPFGYFLVALPVANSIMSGRRKDETLRDSEKSTLQDITEGKEAEEALQTSQQLIEGLLNAIPAGVFWKDRNLNFLGCDNAFARDAGFASSRDVIGKNDFQMSWSQYAEQYRRDDMEVIESGLPKLSIEEAHLNAAGQTLTFLTNKVPL